jgi:hypothetical protein
VQLEEEQDGHQHRGQEHRELTPRRKVRPEVLPGEERRQGEQAQEDEAEGPVHEALALLEKDRHSQFARAFSMPGEFHRMT